jgi:hypothetical protein
MRFDTWKMRTSSRAGSLMMALRELSKYKFHLVGVKVRWEGGNTERTAEYAFFCSKVTENHELDEGFFVHKIIKQQIKGLSF